MTPRLALLVALGTATRLAAQPAPADTLRLAPLQAAALRVDPRARQLALQTAQSERRLRSIAAERLPALSGEAQAQHQSDVVAFPFSLPGGQTPPSPPRDTYDAHLGAQQSIYDPSLAPRRGVERAQLAESQAAVRTSLFALRQEVNEAFFAAALAEARARAADATIVDLDARKREAAARVREGTSLPSDTATLAATILQRRQDVFQLRADRRAALVRLAELTDAVPNDAAIVALPDSGGAAVDVARVRMALDTARRRPEFEQFAAARDRLARQSAATRAAELPRVSAFGRAGYGRPGLNFLNRDFDAYWLAGVQVRWAPWNWGTAGRDREVLALQREIVATNESAFARQLRRAADTDLAIVDRLASTLALDDGIVTLRGRVEMETRARFGEGVVTAADYVSRETELLAARVAREGHRVELAQARARFLTTMGEVP
jgi:outer membrane protein TolC